MARIIENRKHKRVTLLVHFLVDYSARKLHRGLDVSVDIMLLIALLPNAGIPSADGISLEERLGTVRGCPGLGRNRGLGHRGGRGGSFPDAMPIDAKELARNRA